MKYRIVMANAKEGTITMASELRDYDYAKKIVEGIVTTYILTKDTPNFFEWQTPYCYTCFITGLYFFLQKVEDKGEEK